jgi:hypothetical protein
MPRRVFQYYRLYAARVKLRKLLREEREILRWFPDLAEVRPPARTSKRKTPTERGRG